MGRLARVAGGFRRRYGSGPLHLLSLLACFALAGYVASQIAQVPLGARIAIWLVGAVVAHDLVLWPLYTLLDRFLVIGARRRNAPAPWVNHVRVPVVISGCLLAISWPLVLDRTGSAYSTATGLSPSPYTDRWLAVTAALFVASALIFVVRVLISRSRSKPRRPPGQRPGVVRAGLTGARKRRV